MNLRSGHTNNSRSGPKPKKGRYAERDNKHSVPAVARLGGLVSNEVVTMFDSRLKEFMHSDNKDYQAISDDVWVIVQDSEKYPHLEDLDISRRLANAAKEFSKLSFDTPVAIGEKLALSLDGEEEEDELMITCQYVDMCVYALIVSRHESGLE